MQGPSIAEYSQKCTSPPPPHGAKQNKTRPPAKHRPSSSNRSAAYLQSGICINRPVECILRRGGCFLPEGTPRGGVQILEFSASRNPQGRRRAHRTALKILILSPQRLRDRSFFTGCDSWRLTFVQKPVCRHHRLLKTPKNARPRPRPRRAATEKTRTSPLRLQLRQSPNSQNQNHP